MNSLPIIQRELLVSARAAKFYWARTITGLLGFGLLVFFWRGQALSSPGGGEDVFAWLSVVLYMLALFGGAGLMADKVSREKRDGTLGLLYLSTLRSQDLIVGFLTAGVIRFWIILLASAPMLLIPLLLGGLSAADALKTWIDLLNVSFFSLCLCLLISTCVSGPILGMVAAVVCLVGLSIVLPIIDAMLRADLWQSAPPTEPWLLFSPGFAGSVLSEDYGPNEPDFWIIIGFQGLLSLAMLAAASIRLRVMWAAKDFHEQVTSTQYAFKEKSGSSPRGSLLVGARNPIYWLHLRETKYAFKQLALGSLFILIAWAMTLSTEHGGEASIIALLLSLVGFYLMALITAMLKAARRVAEDRRNGALELVLVSPLAAPAFLDGARCAWMRQMLPTTAAVFFILGCIIAYAFILHAYLPVTLLTTWIFCAAIFLIFQLRNIFWLVFWLGLRMKKTNSAVWLALGLELLIPIMLHQILLWLGRFHQIDRYYSQWQQYVYYSLLVAFIANHLLWRGWAKARLHKYFRLAVADPAGYAALRLERKFALDALLQAALLFVLCCWVLLKLSGS